MPIVIDRNKPEGNAFGIMAAVRKELELIGRGHQFKEFEEKATQGDYDNLCRLATEYVPWIRFIDDTIDTEDYEIHTETYRVLKPEATDVFEAGLIPASPYFSVRLSNGEYLKNKN